MRYIRSLLGATLVFAVAAAVSAFSRLPESMPAVHEELVSLSALACNSSCKTCWFTSEHKNEGGGSTHGLGQHSCFEVALACDYHSCSVSAAPPKIDLERMVAESKLDELMDVVPRQNLSFVPERGVVQLLADCGTVIAQLPLPPAAAATRATE
jgi:hypothetical protein